MRLIDDDDLLKIWNDLSERGRKEFDQVIMTQPTSYDLEKVITELEALRIDESNYFGVLNIIAEKYDRANEMLDDALDIVKNGGK